ncbi:uncharacterized protein LOC131007846 [Salvia miltiorrhiza]|uniref:uncharacterized protein LOC131007846 n=1 Tax=Salvia miltiorrhiza TaxID=226208 RepID=UPI0025ACB54D|nr:uncharacterized protein LOC131007846 [Salvia miltiorrhiza]
MIPHYAAGSTKVQALDELLQQRDGVLRRLKENLRQAQARMKQQANRHRRDLEFQVGDQVLVRLQPYRQTSVRGRQAPKLVQRYYGPFPVTERIGQVAYRLELPQSSRIHPVFHVSKLRRFIPAGTTPICSLPAESFDSRPIRQPLAICGERQVLTPAGPQRQVLVQWQGEPPENSTWEARDDMQRQFPSFNLEDKVGLEGMGNDTRQEPTAIGPEEVDKPATEVEEGPNEDSPVEDVEARRTRAPPARFKDYELY